MRIVEDVKLDFSDVLIVPQRSNITSRKDVNITRHFHFKYSGRSWSGIPIISSNMRSVTNEKVATIMSKHGMLVGMPKGKRMWGIEHFQTFGIEGVDTGVMNPWISLDVANGNMQKFSDLVKKTRNLYPFCTLIAGNVVTPEMTQQLILDGADVVKVGIGSGSACATRSVAGVGYPQLSAIIECANAAHGLGGYIISDGGCVTPGDICKAFCAGADFVMLGGMLAGHDENGTSFYGESSKRANEEVSGGLKDYRASEGFEITLDERGPIENTLQNIEGGLRSCGAYIGATKLKDFPKCANFIKVNRQMNESLKEYRD